MLDRVLEVVTRHLDREANLVFGEPLDRRVHAGHSTRTPFRDPRSYLWDARAVQRALERLSTLADVFRNPQLRRLELSWAGFYLGEWTYFVALSVYAFDVGGAAAVGALGLVRMVPAAIALPFGGMLADRYPRQRVLLGIYVARALLLVAMAGALAAESSRALVFALAGLAAVVGAPGAPGDALARADAGAHAARARRDQRLLEHAGGARDARGPGDRRRAGRHGRVRGRRRRGRGRQPRVRPAASRRIRREGDVAGARRRVERSLRHELLGGAHTLVREPHPRLIVLLFNSQTMVRGLLNVLLVVASIELLGMGEAGFGWLNAALGAGALAGGLAAVGLVARRKLAGIFGIALVLWGAPIALVGAWPRAGWALVCLGIVGIGNALLDVSGFTLLQRTVDEHVLGRVFGVFEIGVAVAVALGSLLGSILVEQLGIRTALVVTGAILPFLAALSLPGLRRIDASVEVPERELGLVSEVPLFSPLPPTTLERLAARLERLDVTAGTTVVEQGAAGDRFYLVAGGEIDVVLDGVTMSTLRAGDYFGEIALLRDVPAHCELHRADRRGDLRARPRRVRRRCQRRRALVDRGGERHDPPPGRAVRRRRRFGSRVAPRSRAARLPTPRRRRRAAARRRGGAPATGRARARGTSRTCPTATPPTSADAVKPEPTRSAVDAAVKIAAQEAIVIGLEAVAASDVRNARRGVDTSSGTSPPSRIRNALQSVRAPRYARKPAPMTPKVMRRASISSSALAPSTPSAA